MSLFERHDYQWRETYFVFFEEHRRPKTTQMRRLAQSLGERFEIVEVRGDRKGYFESMTLLAPADCAGIDVVYCSGKDMKGEQEELIKDMQLSVVTPAAKQKLERLRRSTARFEVFHFEHIAGVDDDQEFDQLDPAGLLTVLSKLAEYTHGVIVDPQGIDFL